MCVWGGYLLIIRAFPVSPYILFSWLASHSCAVWSVLSLWSVILLPVLVVSVLLLASKCVV